MTFLSTVFGKYSSNNSTTDNINLNSFYTGTIEDVSGHKSIEITIFVDVNSASNGIELQFNQDGGATMDYIIKDTYNAATQYSKIFPIKGRYFKLKYTNGSTTTSTARIQTVYKDTTDTQTNGNSTQIISSSNSSTINLGSDGVFTGDGEDISQHGSIELAIESDQTSASNGINVQFSDDNSTWVTNSTIGALTYSIANTQFNRSYKIEKKYYRVVYTNGSTAQGRFKIMSILHMKKEKYSEKKQLIKYEDSQLDAFSRIRVSNPTTLYQSKHDQDTGSSTKAEKITGSASKVHNKSEATISLRVFGASSSIIRQSKKYMTYQPGKSLLIMMTCTLDAGKYFLPTPETGYNGNDTISRVGYYDEENGYFLKYEANGFGYGTFKIVQRNSGSGTTVDSEIVQLCWNIDTMDGRGPSGYTIDAKMSNIFCFDLEWLGVGRVRIGMVLAGKIFYVHEFYHANCYSTTYMGTGSLPIRYELTSGSGTQEKVEGCMKEICATVISEGGYLPLGLPFSISMADHTDVTTDLVAKIDQTETPLIALRLKQENRRGAIRILGYSAVCTTGGNVLLRLRYYPEYSDETSNQTPMTKTAAWQSIDTISYAEFDINDIDSSSEMEMTAVGSRIVNTSYFSNNVDNKIDTVERDLTLTSGVENATPELTLRDVVLLTGQLIGVNGSEKINASFSFAQFD